MSFLVFSISCSDTGTHENKSEYKPIKIATTNVTERDITDTVQVFGSVEARNEVNLSSQFSGRLKGFSLLQGDKVKEGQLLGTIIPPMKEALSQVMDNLDENQKKLVANEVNQIPLYSPISGTVVEVMHHTGDVLQVGVPIVHITNLTQLDIYGDLPVVYLKQLRKSMDMKVYFINYDHSPIELPVSALDGKVDDKKQTIQIRLALNNNNEEYRPGMMVKLFFAGEIREKSLVVPRDALLEEEGIYSLFVVKGAVVEQRTVKIGIKQDDFVEIISGVKKGERIATEKVYSLVDGMKVMANK